jgi:hypothetical protein
VDQPHLEQPEANCAVLKERSKTWPSLTKSLLPYSCRRNVSSSVCPYFISQGRLGAYFVSQRYTEYSVPSYEISIRASKDISVARVRSMFVLLPCQIIKEFDFATYKCKPSTPPSTLACVEHGCCIYGEEGIANLIWRSVGHMTSLGTLPTACSPTLTASISYT